MTLIIAIKASDGISIGGDTIGTNLWIGGPVRDDKVFQVWDLIFWVCGSFRVMNILQYHFTPPERGSKVDAKTYMYKYVLEEIKKLFNDKNVSEVENNKHDAYPILIWYEGDIYLLQGDFSMIQHDRIFMTIGAGDEVARWYLEAISASYGTLPRDEIFKGASYRESTIKECIQGVEKHCPTVLGIWKIISQSSPILQKSNWRGPKK